jgi:A/G-specific adenine glycosylase
MVEVLFQDFTQKYPSWKSLVSARSAELKRDLKPIGLWKRKAQVLLDLAAIMTTRRGRFPNTRDELEALPGVGQYIANAILLLCHARQEPLLDGSMVRLLERYFGPRTLVDFRFDPYLQTLAHAVVASTDSRALNWAMLDLAATICTRINPQCAICPLRKGCRYVTGFG